jgi:type I restriction enzyme S subunit
MKDWKTINLGDSATFINGYPFKPSEWGENGLEIIRIQNLTKGASTINYFEGTKAEKYKVKKGDLLISWSATLGIYEWAGNDAWLNQHIFKVIFDKEIIDKSYFKFFISASLSKMAEQAHGATMKHITKKKFDSLQIPLPPLIQQQKIAKILDASDELRQNDKKLIAKYDALTQALFLDMFGDPLSNPKGWEKKSGKEYCLKISVGVVIKPASFYVDNGVIALRAMNIRPNKIIKNGFVYFSEKNHAEVLSKSIIYTNDVLIVRTGSTGTATVVPIEYNNCNCIDSIICRPNKSIINPFYLSYFFNSQRGKEMVAQNEVGGIQKHFNIGTLNNLEIPIPSIQLQNQFAERVALIEEQKEIAQRSLEKSEALFNSLLQKAFKGELE